MQQSQIHSGSRLIVMLGCSGTLGAVYLNGTYDMNQLHNFSSTSTAAEAPTSTRTFGVAHVVVLALGLALLSFGLVGCGSGKTAAAPPAPAVHTVAAVSGEVVDWDTFTGRFEAVESVKLRPRVSGYIEQVTFAEGKEVKKGDILFVIDQRSYRVQLEKAQSELARATAQVELSAKELQRTERLLQAHAVSQEEYDQRASQRNQLQADVQAARASVDAAQLDLEYTRVASPIDGRVSRAEVTAGNYVNKGESILTSVVSLDPIYVYFEGDEQTFLKYAELTKRGERPSARDTANPVFVGLANEEDFPHAATMNFVDNALNPETGTIRSRAVIANPDHLFTPGMLARVRLQGSGKYTAALIPDEAVVTDQDRKYVLVINPQNVAEYRAVELGGVFDNQRIVRGGLQVGEQIVSSGLQRVRAGMTVAPTLEQPGTDAKNDAKKVAQNNSPEKAKY
ncbi:MAG: efflux transporter periplasmic adaptor subunit [Verrucomicrobiaceae bacterium]|nr:efflux transporter periplasmic adaptor subunit [Verrucomicrobiaceae bacterium]